MELFSRLFLGDAKLNAALKIPSAHLELKKPPTPRERGSHVRKVQQALFRLGHTIDRAETNATEYGPSTANAVFAFKSKRTIINRAYQNAPDNIVGRLTIEALDNEMRTLDRENGFSPEVHTLRPPAYEAQILANSCWAACLVMWHRSQGLGSFTQQAFIATAPTLQIGPGGIDIDGLQTVVDDTNAVSLVKMGTLRVNSKDDVPNLRALMFSRGANGHIYLAFPRASSPGGHCHLLFGFTVDDFGNGLIFDALDPDRNVGQTRTTMGTYFSKFPALVGFRQA
jgi:hypothetical protein